MTGTSWHWGQPPAEKQSPFREDGSTWEPSVAAVTSEGPTGPLGQGGLASAAAL